MPHILVVEDEVLINTELSQELRDTGYEVCSTYNAAEALAYLERYAPKVDLVISDNKMPPGMSGADLLKLIKEKHPHIRRMMVSGNEPEDARDFVDVYLPKPFGPQQVLPNVSALLVPVAA